MLKSRFDIVARASEQGEVEPGAVIVDGEQFEVMGIDDRWHDPMATYFKVAAADGRIYLVRRDAEDATWSLVQVWQLDA